MNTNKFHREFLWSQCARMCNAKFPPAHYRQYKPRFECMEQCYASYTALSPHHSLARYCIQASCPHPKAGQIHQVDCFSSCSAHVASSVAKSDWQDWANALAGPCQQEGEEGEAPSHTHRLECADSKVWSSITSPLASHCLQHICQEDIRCGTSCLTLPSAQKLSCADTCLAQQREEAERKERERRRNEERRQQALLSVRSSSTSLLLSSLLLLLPLLL